MQREIRLKYTEEVREAEISTVAEVTDAEFPDDMSRWLTLVSLNIVDI